MFDKNDKLDLVAPCFCSLWDSGMSSEDRNA